MAPFFSGGGYCSEAISYMKSLSKTSDFQISISQHGDIVNKQFMKNIDLPTYELLR